MELHTPSGNPGNGPGVRRRLRGFTFVELMVVIAIIVILIGARYFRRAERI
jgi:prepilin-type N-terminal cleavage/methylation domain-containing protein